MSQLASALQNASEQNTRLLEELSKTDYAASSHAQNAAYLADLTSQISDLQSRLKELHAITDKERKDFQKLNDSTVSRFLHKLGGSKSEAKFNDKTAKEEKEFLDALQTEKVAEGSLAAILRAKEQAESDRQRLQTDLDRHSRAQAELDKLYNSLFDGPTPDVPGEDARETALRDAKGWFEHLNSRVAADKHALEILTAASSDLQNAGVEIKDARNTSRFDTFGGGGIMTDMFERDSLTKAQTWVSMTNQKIEEARRFQPAIRPLGAFGIDQGHKWSDIVFDNPFSDYRHHQRIKDSMAQIEGAMQDLTRQIEEQKGRIGGSEVEVRRAGDGLENARRELQRVRIESFQHLAGSATSSSPLPPPPYKT